MDVLYSIMYIWWRAVILSKRQPSFFWGGGGGVGLHCCMYQTESRAPIFKNILLCLCILYSIVLYYNYLEVHRYGNLPISRHSSVVCGKKAGDHTMSIFTGKKTAFSCVHSSMAPSPKHTIFALYLSPK